MDMVYLVEGNGHMISTRICRLDVDHVVDKF